MSVIIPNKDHIGELDACVRSIIEKSAYREFEVVIVENNSEDDGTFAYYERITAEFDQVKVVQLGGIVQLLGHHQPWRAARSW